MIKDKGKCGLMKAKEPLLVSVVGCIDWSSSTSVLNWKKANKVLIKHGTGNQLKD
jgi:hypothetical protein